HEVKDSLTLFVKWKFNREWIMDNFHDLIEDTASQIIGRQIKVILTTELPEENIKGIQLNFWPRIERAVPNPILRSALFGIVQRGRRELLNDELLASWKGVKLIYSGERLNQNDLDVWMQVLELHRENELGKPTYFTWRGLLKELNKTGGGRDIEWLKKTINRLTKSHILIQTERYTYAGGLLHDWGEDDF